MDYKKNYLKEMKFKSNINCGSCVKAVSSTLDNSSNVEKL